VLDSLDVNGRRQKNNPYWGFNQRGLLSFWKLLAIIPAFVTISVCNSCEVGMIWFRREVALIVIFVFCATLPYRYSYYLTKPRLNLVASIGAFDEIKASPDEPYLLPRSIGMAQQSDDYLRPTDRVCPDDETDIGPAWLSLAYVGSIGVFCALECEMTPITLVHDMGMLAILAAMAFLVLRLDRVT
jgi:hypothetical protein